MDYKKPTCPLCRRDIRKTIKEYNMLLENFLNLNMQRKYDPDQFFIFDEKNLLKILNYNWYLNQKIDKLTYILSVLFLDPYKKSILI